MFKLNLKQVLWEQGIQNPNKFLWQNGFTRHTAFRLLHHSQSGINFKHLEKLCLLLTCTPEELLVWQSTPKVEVPNNHPLHKLKAQTFKGDLNAKLKQIPVNKLLDLHNYVDGLRNQA